MDDFEITKREVIASVTIIAFMMILGFLLAGSITEWQVDRNKIYNQAIDINEQELFEYGMRTNVGYAFVHGELKAVDTVGYPEIDGKYMYIEKVKEKYTMHTRTVPVHCGKTTTYRTETYWTWDRVGSEAQQCKKVTFLGVEFDSNRIDIPGASHIDTIKESSHVRYKYYGTGVEHEGTIFAMLKEGTVLDGDVPLRENVVSFYNDMDIDQTRDMMVTGNGPIIAFWIFWVILTGVLVVLFYRLENRWLE